MKIEARLYEKLEKNSVHCYLCSHHCKIADSKFGFCGVRQNIGGTLFTLVYGEVIASHVDPIEKKPLYHFLPGSVSYSIATIGCNFHCGFCQNWQISQVSKRSGGALEGNTLMPEEVVREAKRTRSLSISYTYTEPTIFFEYAYDTAKLASEAGLKNVFVTNGFMTLEAIDQIRPYLDAANVDLKFFKDSSYKEICSGSLEPVLNSIRAMKSAGIWVEITTLLVPGKNDSPEELEGITGFIAEVDKDMPWHISRFHPDYKFMDYAPTPVETLMRAQKIGEAAGIRYIYLGNVYAREGSNTSCPNCKKVLIERIGFEVIKNEVRDSQCAYCGAHISGIFDEQKKGSE